jgi:hypothetical protein
MSAVACGGEVNGVRLLAPRTIDRIFEVQSDGIDRVIGIPLKFGVGYSLTPERRYFVGLTPQQSLQIVLRRRASKRRK